MSGLFLLPAAPFPYDATLDALTAFFADVAPVNCVRMRRHLQSKDFRGSIFIEFASEEVAKEVCTLWHIHILHCITRMTAITVNACMRMTSPHDHHCEGMRVHERPAATCVLLTSWVWILRQVLGKDLEYEGAKLKLEPKLDYVQRKFEDRKAKAGQKAQAAPEKAEVCLPGCYALSQQVRVHVQLQESAKYTLPVHEKYEL